MTAVKQIEASARAQVGKGAARAVRRQGQTPAVIYGGNTAPVAIALDANKTRQLIFGGHFLTTIFEISVAGKKQRVIPVSYTHLDVYKRQTTARASLRSSRRWPAGSASTRCSSSSSRSPGAQ